MSCSRTLLLSVVCLVGSVQCFNVDTENFVRHSGTPGSMFGFSVAEHKDRGSSWVLVGAPEAQTRQPGVSRGGAVFRCDVTRDDACQEVPFDVTGNNNNSQGAQLDRKSDQWFGATVSSSGADGVIVACAPRYVWFAPRVDQREPVGTCYVAKNSFSDFSEYSPCRTRNWGHHRQGSCQAGLGAAVSKDGERLYVGAVGAWYWQGQLHSVPSDTKLRFLPTGKEEFGVAGQVFSQSLSTRPQFYQTREGPPQDDDSYLGYSVVAGDFDGSGQPGAAVGMPKGSFLKGKVVLYTWDLKNSQNITGEQIGGYFGYSLCTSDIDGDGLDDLIIGAPMFSAVTNNNEMKYETGRIYVVYQGTEDKFRYMSTRDGINSKGRFGLSLAGLGDINKDGYGDVAVGAPYDGPSERGAVYIYHGSNTGLMEKPSQVIFAEDIRPDISTFGFSLAGGLDLDDNEYPDVVVGAYESETAVFLRSRPVIKMSASLLFGAESKMISLKERNCTTRDGTPVTCIPIKGCLEYSGVGVDRRIDFEIQFLLDSKKTRDVRMFFMTHEGRYSQNYSIKLEKGKQYCKSEIVYIKSSIRDKLTPLEAELRYSLKSAGGAVLSDSRRVARSLTPILDQNMAAVQKDSVNIEKNCGKDNICIPDLKLIARPIVDQYLLGSGERFEIDVVVENNGEDAFEATYNLRLPPGMNYTRIARIDDFEQEIPVQCSAPSPSTNNTLRCDIGNPLPKRKLVHFKVLMSPFHRAGMKSRYEFFMEVNTTNPENKSSTFDNSQTLSIPIWVQTDHIVSGYSYPSDIPYNISQYRSVNVTKESEIGPQVVHIYSIKNHGPSDIVEAEAFFVWPSHTQEDDELLYLLEQPQTNGHVRCEIVNSANALKLQLDSRNKKSYLELHGVTVDSSYNSGVTDEQSSSSTSNSFSSSSSGGGGTYVHTSSGDRYDRNRITGHRGEHAMTDEERRAFELESEERHTAQSQTGRRVHESGSSSSSHNSSHSSSFGSQSAGERVQGGGANQGGRGQSFEYNRTEEYSRQGGGGSGVYQGGSGSSEATGTRNQGGRGQINSTTITREYSSNQSGGGGGRVITSSSSQGGRESSYQGGYGGRDSQGGRDNDARVSQGGGEYDGRQWQGGRGNDGRGSQSGGDYDARHSQGGRGNEGRVSQGGGESDGRQSQGGRGNEGRVSQGGGESDGRYSQGGRGNEGRVSQGGGDNDGRYSQGGGRTRVHGDIPEEDGAYVGSRGRGSGGLTTLEQDYRSFGSNPSQSGRERERDREEWRRNQASRAEWRANQGGRVLSTGDYSSGGSRTYSHGEGHNTEESRVYEQSGAGGGGYSSSTRTHSQGSSGDNDGRERSHNQGSDYSAGGSRVYHQGGSGSSSSRTYTQGNSGDYSAGGTRIGGHGSGGVHEEYGSIGGGGNLGGHEERTRHESRNFTATYSEDGNAPRHFSNFSFANFSTGGKNVSGGWQSGEDLGSGAHSSNVGTGHSGSHETVSRTSRIHYGDAVESHLERHGSSGISRSGYNVGNPSSAERTNSWSTETRTHSSSGGGGGAGVGVLDSTGDGLALYNWTKPVDGFGAHSGGSGRRTDTEHSRSESRQWSSDTEGHTEEPGLRRTYSRRESRAGGEQHSGDQKHNARSSSLAESSSSKTEFEGAETRSRNFQSKESTGINSVQDVDSRFQLYKRFERSVGELINLDDRGREEMRVQHKRSVGADETWDREVNDEAYGEDSVARQASNSELDRILDCSVPKCTRMRCVVGPLKKDEEVFVGLRYRVWVRTLEKIGWNRAAKLSTLMAARVTELPHVGEPFEMKLKTAEIPMEVFPTDVPVRPDIVPLWVVVLSACAGAIILLLLIFLLYKCGFFKRNRPTDSAEKEPLNRNGHYNSGDEAL